MEGTKDIYLDGAWVPSTSRDTIEVRSPSTGEVLATVPDAGTEDVDAAVGAARRAFDRGPWPGMAPAERARLMQAFLDALTARGDELAQVIAAENGTPLTVSRPAQVDNGLDVLRYYVELAGAFQPELPRAGRYSPAVVRQEPVGTVAAIIPWNVPFFLAMVKLGPALAAGCTVVLKAAPETPLNANLIAAAADEAGLPPGVVNVLAAGPTVSEHLATHPDVDKVAFTGSTAVGKHLAGLCAAQLKRITLELGGKSAAVVLDDADLTRAMPHLVFLSMSLTGQFCTAQSRILVSRNRYDEAVETFTNAASRLVVGDPFDEATTMGPLISGRQRERVLGYVARGEAEGATLVTGGGVPADLERGWFIEPTVFRDVRNDMTIAQEEIFGPVVAFIPYDDVDEAVAIANDSIYGLHGTVWTADVAKGLEVGRRVRTGTYTVNGMSLDPAAPFGGMKCSGVGRELGPEGLAGYLEAKTITVPVGTKLPGLA